MMSVVLGFKFITFWFDCIVVKDCCLYSFCFMGLMENMSLSERLSENSERLPREGAGGVIVQFSAMEHSGFNVNNVPSSLLLVVP